MFSIKQLYAVQERLINGDIMIGMDDFFAKVGSGNTLLDIW